MDSHIQDSCAQNLELDTITIIRNLNDKLRRSQKGGQLFVTRGIIDLGRDLVPEIINAVSQFDNFNLDNDPYSEHDFGALSVGGHKVFWKIDYYDREMQNASPDPADPSVTTRVLTVLLATEY